jgi:hypothetical protein
LFSDTAVTVGKINYKSIHACKENKNTTFFLYYLSTRKHFY